MRTISFAAMFAVACAARTDLGDANGDGGFVTEGASSCTDETIATANGPNAVGAVLADHDDVFWMGNRQLWKHDPSENVLLLDLAPNKDDVANFVVRTDDVVVATALGFVLSVPREGGAATVVASNLPVLRVVASSPSGILATYGDKEIQLVRIDTAGAIQPLFAWPIAANGAGGNVVVDGNSAYVTTPNAIIKVDPITATTTTIVANITGLGMFVWGDQLFFSVWEPMSGGSLLAVDKNGGTPSVVFSSHGVDTISAIAVDASGVYFILGATGYLQNSSLIRLATNGNTTTLAAATPNRFLESFALTPQSIVYTQSGDGIGYPAVVRLCK